jgi:tRNA nucleotidyltransferase (CCA-adding enzyme)
MDLILCHTTADFDSLGAAVGLSRLLPGSRIVLSGGTHPAVGEFLALHRDEYPLIERRSVNPLQIRSITVVDTCRQSQLGKAAEWLTLPQLHQLRVYDHHTQLTPDIPTPHIHLEPIGATTTLIVEQLQAAGIQPTAFEATVMALGIHVDTGSLTYPQSTSRDARAIAWLMDQGASLQVVAEYVEPGLSPLLQDLLSEALEQFQLDQHHGYQIRSVLLPTAQYLPGLSSLASQLLDITDSDAVLLGVRYPVGEEERITVIGRSAHRDINLAPVFQAAGGGGHAQAASLSRRGDHPEQLLDQLRQALLDQLPEPPQAQDLMSSPVRTIRPETTISEAQRVLLRYGHSGLSVVDEQGQLAGVISRRDLDIALHHGFGHAPVKGYMALNPKTISPKTPLPEIEALMVTYDIGRLPVLEAGQLMGIVTRTDVLRQLHQGHAPGDRLAGFCPLPTDVADLLQHRLVPELWNLLARAARHAESRGWNLYLVGGGVRDLLLADPTTPLQLSDIDLVVDGYHRALTEAAGVELAQALQAWYPAARLEVHGRFQTAALLWHQDPLFGSLWVDIATARTEFYPYPAANPEVESSSIQQDLYRRDFTINALAVRLTAPRVGALLDYFGGLLDLEAQQIRVLHPNSFIEDPTRIYRAVRFAVKLGFQLEARTEDYIRYALESGVFERTRGENGVAPALQTRLRAELRTILEAPYWQAALQLLGQLNALRCLHPKLQLDRQLGRSLRLINQAWQWLHRHYPGDEPRPRPTEPPISHWLLLLETLLTSLPATERSQVAQDLQLPIESIRRLQQVDQAVATLQAGLSPLALPSDIVYCLREVDVPSLLLSLPALTRQQRRQLWTYLTRWLDIRSPLSGEDLRVLGYRPGPQFREMLDQLLRKLLDGEFPQGTPAAIAALAADYLQQHFPLPAAENNKSRKC